MRSRSAVFTLLGTLLAPCDAFACAAPRWTHAQSAPSAPVRLRSALGALQAVARVRLVAVGKTKERWLESAIDEYAKRLRRTLELELVWVKDDAALRAQVARTDGPCIILDERGKAVSSVEFGERLYAGLEKGGSRLSFFIGGADGLPPELKADRSRLLSLSSLTLTHQHARLLLVEQIYRASEIRRGSGYHKD